MTPQTVARIEAVWQELLGRVQAGEALRDACPALGIDRTDVWRYRRANKTAAVELHAAMEDGADSLVDDLDATIISTADPRVARVRAEFIWRRAAARNPDRYADRQRVDVRAVSLDLSTIINEAQRRLAVREAMRTVQHVPLALADLL